MPGVDFLYVLLTRAEFAAAARAIFGPFRRMYPIVKFAPDANAERGFEKKEDEARDADEADARGHAVRDGRGVRHERREDEPYPPCEPFLRSADVLRFLSSDDHSGEDDARRVFGIDEQPDGEVHEECRREQPGRKKIPEVTRPQEGE